MSFSSVFFKRGGRFVPFLFVFFHTGGMPSVCTAVCFETIPTPRPFAGLRSYTAMDILWKCRKARKKTACSSATTSYSIIPSARCPNPVAVMIATVYHEQEAFFKLWSGYCFLIYICPAHIHTYTIFQTGVCVCVYI